MIEDLYPAWLARDWEAWARALPEVARKAASYREDAKRFEADDVLLVAFGETGAATLAPRSRPHGEALPQEVLRRTRRLVPRPL